MSDIVLCLGDLHAEWVNRSCITKLLDSIIPSIKPTIICQLGDAYDLLSFSRFPRSHNLTTPSNELSNARICLEELWGAIRKKAPKAKCYQLLGNHDTRIYARLKEKIPELDGIVNLNHLWDFKGVTTIHDYREELVLEINGELTCFMHGYRSKLGDHAKANQMSTIRGHSHRAGIAYIPLYDSIKKEKRVIYEMDCGFLGDPKSKVMAYSSQSMDHMVNAVGVIDKHGPRIIRL